MIFPPPPSPRPFRTPTFLAVTLAMTVAAGCLAEHDPARSTGNRRIPIYNGAPDTSPEHMAVVALTYGPGTGYFCTGTLITQRVVLTAAHCLQGVQPHQLFIFFGNDVYAGPGDYVAAADKEVHPDYNNGQVVDDIAMVQLAADAPAGIVPIRHLPSALELTPADVGTNLDYSGFGDTENQTDGEKLHVIGPLGLVCPGPNDCTFLGQTVPPRSWAYDMFFGGPCFGDSGGPAFIFRNGCEYVAGTTSTGDAECLVYGINAKVDGYQAWIDAYIQAAGVEDCATPGDDDGDGDANCGDPDCACHPACQTAPEDCVNGTDDDGDGSTDCADHECLTHPACQTQPDGSAPGPDGTGPQPDGAQPQPDGTQPRPDGTQPAPDGQAQADGSQPDHDGGSGSAGSKGGCDCRQLPGSGPPFAPILLFVLMVLRPRRGSRT